MNLAEFKIRLLLLGAIPIWEKPSKVVPNNINYRWDFPLEDKRLIIYMSPDGNFVAYLRTIDIPHAGFGFKTNYEDILKVLPEKLNEFK